MKFDKAVGVILGGSVPWVELARQGQVGLIRTREQAEALGGHLTITSTLGAGTTIQVVVPRLPNRN